MTKLSAEAYAVVEGRHSDPFHYLGLHSEGDRTVVRVFLPEAEGGGRRRARRDRELLRIHKAGCSRPLRTARRRYRCARDSATTSSSSRTPIAFRRY